MRTKSPVLCAPDAVYEHMLKGGNITMLEHGVTVTPKGFTVFTESNPRNNYNPLMKKVAGDIYTIVLRNLENISPSDKRDLVNLSFGIPCYTLVTYIPVLSMGDDGHTQWVILAKMNTLVKEFPHVHTVIVATRDEILKAVLQI